MLTWGLSPKSVGTAQLVERQCTRDRDVQRLGAVRQRDACHGPGVHGHVVRQAGALAAQGERDRGLRRELGERAVASGVEGDQGQLGRLAQRDHGHRVERAHARAHGARRERVGAALGERDVRGPEALRAAQQRAEIAGVGDAVQLQPDLALG